MHVTFIRRPIGCFLQIALVSTALAAIGWVVFLGGFGFLTTNR